MRHARQGLPVPAGQQQVDGALRLALSEIAPQLKQDGRPAGLLGAGRQRRDDADAVVIGVEEDRCGIEVAGGQSGIARGDLHEDVLRDHGAPFHLAANGDGAARPGQQAIQGGPVVLGDVVPRNVGGHGQELAAGDGAGGCVVGAEDHRPAPELRHGQPFQIRRPVHDDDGVGDPFAGQLGVCPAGDVDERTGQAFRRRLRRSRQVRPERVQRNRHQPVRRPRFQHGQVGDGHGDGELLHLDAQGLQLPQFREQVFDGPFTARRAADPRIAGTQGAHRLADAVHVQIADGGSFAHARRDAGCARLSQIDSRPHGQGGEQDGGGDPAHVFSPTSGRLACSSGRRRWSRGSRRRTRPASVR